MCIAAKAVAFQWQSLWLTRVSIKKTRTQGRSDNGKEHRFENSEDFARLQDQPRSAFWSCNFFWEEFANTGHDGDEIDVDRRGFETWRNMSKMYFFVITGKLIRPIFFRSMAVSKIPPLSAIRFFAYLFTEKEAIQNYTPLLRQLPHLFFVK
ncbi:unnamed protein product [Cuscuta campestris]|uniref:Uncharacterized protein n=1 Tax=Cuscuta campestris TaxID=132261 RepID=A0A484LZA4_9ASTE|nr:unnamed protein product [Cuscuta campestris]